MICGRSFSYKLGFKLKPVFFHQLGSVSAKKWGHLCYEYF